MKEPCPPKKEGRKDFTGDRAEELLSKHLTAALGHVEVRAATEAKEALDNAANYASASVRRKVRKATELVDTGRFWAASLILKEVLGC